MRLLLALPLLVFMSCSTQVPDQQLDFGPKTDDAHLETKSTAILCTENKDPVACANAGYAYKAKHDLKRAHQYYALSCQYEGTESCSIVKKLEEGKSYYTQVEEVMKKHGDRIMTCYRPPSEGTFPELQKGRVEEDFQILINTLQGRAEEISSEAEGEEAFRKCAERFIKTISFPRNKHLGKILYHYRFTILP